MACQKRGKRKENGCEVRELPQAHREEIEVTLLFHEVYEHIHEAAELLVQPHGFRSFTPGAGNGIGVAALFHERRSEIRFLMLYPDVVGLKFPADDVREPRGKGGIDKAHPEHVARHGDAEDFGAPRKCPKNDRETPDREKRIKKTHREVKREGDEVFDVLTHTLIGIVGFFAAFAQQVVGTRRRQPPVKKHVGDIASEGNDDPVLEVTRGYEKRNDDGRKTDEKDELPVNGVFVHPLQRVVKTPVPVV